MRRVEPKGKDCACGSPECDIMHHRFELRNAGCNPVTEELDGRVSSRVRRRNR